jgi:hypothetical protein
MDEREGPQAEPVRLETGEDVGALSADPVVFHGLDEAPQYPGALRRLLQEHEVLRFAQLDLDWQGIGLGHGAVDDSTPFVRRQPEGLGEGSV